MEKLKKLSSCLYCSVLCLFIYFFYVCSVISANIRIAILSLSIIVILILAIKKYLCSNHMISGIKIPVIIFLATFVSRYGYCNFMDKYISQTSDFAVLLHSAQTGIFSDELEYYRFYAHKFLYPFLLYSWHIRSQSQILFFQCVCVSTCAVALYYIGKRIANDRIGALAALMYIIWPAQIIYTQIITEEHMAVLLMSLIILMIIHVAQRFERIESFKSVDTALIIIETIMIGGIGGVCAFFKDWALIIFVALVICCIHLCFEYRKAQRILLLVCVLSVLGIRWITCWGITYAIENKLQANVNNNVIFIQMYATLDPNSNGEWNPTLNAEYYQIIKDNNFDLKKSRHTAMEILKEKIKKDYDKIPRLLFQKARSAYANDSAMFCWALENEAGVEFKSRFPWFYPLIEYIDYIYYMGIVICLIVSAFLVRNKYNFFVLLCIFGGCMASLLIESQGRYKYSIEPIWCVSAAYGFFSCAMYKVKFYKKAVEEEK